MALAPFLNPNSVSRGLAEILRPPRRMLPSEAVKQYLRTEKGAWNPDLATMMIEPLNLLAGRRYTGICYVGPSRGSKTMTLVLGSLTYIVTCSPGDTQITQMSQDTGRTFSKTDLARAIRHSPELQARLSPRPRDDNVFDKFFRSGMSLNVAWPSASQHSSKTLKYSIITDYDRPENRDDVDGEGTLWDVAYARIRTYLSRGKQIAESSPGGEYHNPQWRPETPHEAPPSTGIAAIYNRGTRARLYWPCMHCDEFFQAAPGLQCFKLPDFEELEQEVQKRDLMWLAEQFARIACPQCGGIHEIQHKPELNLRGRWVHEGESINANGKIEGERRRTDIASYWQGGVASSYQRWDQLLLRYLQGVLTYVRTGDEGSLKTTTNTDQAWVYLPRSIAKRRSAEELLKRVEDWPQGVVPAGVRFLTAQVDVQGNRFVVQVHGWGIGLESWMIDRFMISASCRPEGDRHAALDPAAYLEDWELLLDAVVRKTYPLEHMPEVHIAPLITLCDSGGREGVTERAYEFWRTLRGRGLARQFMLVKGVPSLNAPRAVMTWPDARGRKDRAVASKGDVPVWMLNVNVIKDGVVADLGRKVPGPGFIHLPKWAESDYFLELTSESRRADGRWERPSGVRNEAFDLHVYARAACIVLNAENINWESPPDWATDPATRPAAPTPATPATQRRRVRSSGVK
jgi:phage terminase large subunit GpA-like protein